MRTLAAEVICIREHLRGEALEALHALLRDAPHGCVLTRRFDLEVHICAADLTQNE